MTHRTDVIAIIDKTSKHTPPAGVLDRIAAGLQHQLVYDVCPKWRRDATHVVVGEVPSAHPMFLVDQLDVAQALGYHDDGSSGPFSMIGVDVILANGGDWTDNPQLSVSSVMSHEACEQVIDPSCHLWADDGNGTLYALETADPVEAESYRNLSHQVMLSNFVHPGWFDPAETVDFDQMGTCAKPFEIRPRGYGIVSKQGQVSQVWGNAQGEFVPSRAARIGTRSRIRGVTAR